MRGLQQILLAILALVTLPTSALFASKWSVSPLNSVTLTTGGFPVAELSGVTYLGPSPVTGNHRFAAIQDDGALLTTIDIQLSTGGSLTSAAAVEQLLLEFSNVTDFEGVVYTGPARNSYFVSNEGRFNLGIPPGFNEYNTDGEVIQSVSIPSVFSTFRDNRGFEALARNSTGTKMWIANEEALTADGPASSLNAPTTVRIVELVDNGGSISLGAQYAYEVDPVHGGTSLANGARSGLPELLSLPDGTLLALERSAANTLPLFQNRFYEVNFEGATDISATPYAEGLVGQSYDAITNGHGKTLLWAGAAGGGIFGQNMEGIALGPRLASGSWMILGVVDNGNSGGNTLLSFLLTANPSADFDEDSDIDGRDFLAWQRGYGTTIGAEFAQGDADRDGDVDDADLMLWETSYAALVDDSAVAVPEPAAIWLVVSGFVALSCRSRMRHIALASR